MAGDQDADRERHAKTVIRGTFEQVKAWRLNPRFEPLPGSELANDNAAWLPMPLTEVVCLSLDFASEQLDQVRALIEADCLSLTSQRVLIRTALVSASIALWIIGPDDAQTRQARHRSYIEQNTFRHLKALSAQVDIESASGQPVQPVLLQMVTHVEQQLATIQSLRASHGEQAQWNDTEIIRRAATLAFKNQPDPVSITNEALFEFKVASSAAHGLPWGLFNAVGTVSGPADKDGRALMTLVPSYGALVNAYMAAYWISVAAWRQLAKRGR